MSTAPDVAFIRNYFACYKTEPNCSDLANDPVKLEHDLEDCCCALNCSFKLSLEARLLIRACYQRLTPEGRVAFLIAHVREPTSPGQAQYCLPKAGNGLEKVCEEHFLNTLQETRDRIQQVVWGKRKSAGIGALDSKEILPNKRVKRDSQRMDVNAGEGIEKDMGVENGLGDFPVDLNCVKVEAIEPEKDETEQLILPGGPSVSNQGVAKANDLDVKIPPDSEEVSKSLNNPVEHEPIDIKTETNELETDHDEFMEVAPSDDDSVDEDLSFDPKVDNEGTLSSKQLADKLRRERKVRGLSYTSTSGRTVPARAVKPNCGPTCPLQCNARLSEEVRQELLAMLLQKSEIDQIKYLADHICSMPSSLRYSLDGRQFNHYFLPVESQLVRVCKTMFMNTYDLTMKVLRRIILNKIDKHVVSENPNFPPLQKKRSKVCGPSKTKPQHVWCKCKLKCWSMFPEEVIEPIQSSYGVKSKHEQYNFLSKHIQLLPATGERFTRILTRARFFLPFGSTVKEVCRNMFLRTFNLKATEVSSLLNILEENPYLLITVAAPVECSVNDAEPRKDKLPCSNSLDGNDHDVQILPDSAEIDPVEFEQVDIKTEIKELEPEHDEFTAVLPRGGDSVNGILTDFKVESKTPSEAVEHEPLDIKIETNELDTNHDEYMIILPRDDDSCNEESLLDPEAGDDGGGHSATDSQGEINPSEVEAAGPSSSKPKRKERKPRGLRYISRTIKPNCGASCQLQCGTRVSDEIRQKLLAVLMQKTKTEQRKFLGDHICNMPSSSRYRLAGRQSNRFFLPVEFRLVRVCKTMFMNTYDLSDKIIRSAIAKKSGAKHEVCGNPNFPLLMKKPGKFYFNYDEGRDKPPEVCSCSNSCASKFPVEVIEQIQHSLRERSKKEQEKFLSKFVQCSNDRTNLNKKSFLRARYLLPYGSTEHEVCRSMFQYAFKLHTRHVRALVDALPPAQDPFEMAREHIAGHRMEEDHHCAVSGRLSQLSTCPNVARMYSKYREERCRRGQESIDYGQYFKEFCLLFKQTGLLRPTSCPDCGYFDRGEEG